MANYSGFGFDYPSFSADADLSSNQWFLVTTASTAGNVKLATGGSNPVALGVLQDDPKAGEACVVRLAGTTKVFANGGTAIAYGDYLVSNASGHAISVTSASSVAAGIAMEALSSGCGYIEMLLLAPGAATHADNVP